MFRVDQQVEAGAGQKWCGIFKKNLVLDMNINRPRIFKKQEKEYEGYRNY